MKAPQSQWQVICDDDIQIINLIGDYEVLNDDVRPENFLVRTNPEGKYQVFQIDFGETHHRDGMAWAKWRHWKYCIDEEGAVGSVMQQRLIRGFEYKRSFKYLKYDE